MDVPLLASVLVVNYNGRSFLDECLGSLKAQSLPKNQFEVIFVDNASSDGSVEFVRASFPWVRVIEAGSNLGFAGGNNAGLQHSRGRWIALLNSDAAAEPDWLSASIAAGESAAKVGGVASHIVFRDEPKRINSTGLELLSDGRGADRDFGRLESEVHRPQGPVFGGCGAGLVLRRTMLDEIGFFDRRLFMYYEDLDLAWRAHRRGWQFLYEPTARVRHVFGGSAVFASPLQMQYVERNRCLVNLKHASLPIAVVTTIGAVARLGRTGLRWMFARQRYGLTTRHIAANFKAVVSVFANLPRVLFERFAASASPNPR